MAGYNAFESGDDYSGFKGPEKPFWALDFDDDEALLDWLNAETEHLKQQGTERHINQRKNLAMFRGIQYQTQDIKTREESVDKTVPQGKRSKNPRVVYNHISDMVEQDVSRATKYRGAISCTPPTDDCSDRQVAEVAENLIEQYWDKGDFDHTVQRHVRRKNIYSEDFFGVFWNQNLGPYDLDWVASVFKSMSLGDPSKMTRGEIRQIWRKKVKEIPRLPLLGDDGKQMIGTDMEPLWINKPQRRGDIQYRLITSCDMFMQRKSAYEECEYGSFREFVHVDTVRAMHPSKASEIEPDKLNVWDFDRLEDESPNNMVEIWHTFHKSTDQLDQGRYIKWCRTAILKNRTNPYLGWDDRARFPWARTVDIETPEVLNGDSKITFGRPCQAIYNNLISMRVRSHFLVAHPKWFFQQGSVKSENLSNGSTLVSFKGPMAPILSQPTVPPNDEALLNRSKEDLQQIMAVYGVSRGEPPAGVTAAVALTFLDEQENERGNVGVAALTRTQRDVALMTLWLMADHYDEERLTEIVGKTKADIVKGFEMSNLRNISDLRVNNASALPQQKSARTQYLLDIKKEWPGLLPDDIAIDLLDLGEVKRFQNIITVAVRKADEENDKLMNGKVPLAPEVQEYHLVHYRIHVRQMNEPFYANLGKASKDHSIEHLMAHEMLMCQMVERFPAYAQKIVAEFPGFPMFFKAGAAVIAQAMMPPPMPGQGQPQKMPPPDQMPPPEQAPGADALPMPGAEEAQPINQGIDPGAGLTVPT